MPVYNVVWIAELFFAEAERKVKKDNTFSFAGRRYETPVDLRYKTIQLLYDRRRHNTAAIVIYNKGQRMGAARLLDATNRRSSSKNWGYREVSEQRSNAPPTAHLCRLTLIKPLWALPARRTSY